MSTCYTQYIREGAPGGDVLTATTDTVEEIVAEYIKDTGAVETFTSRPLGHAARFSGASSPLAHHSHQPGERRRLVDTHCNMHDFYNNDATRIGARVAACPEAAVALPRWTTHATTEEQQFLE